MTLVVSCITPNHVVQVSDRQLIWVTGPNAGKIADHATNKALVVCNRLCIGYTGLAQIGGLKTDEWLVEVANKVLPYNLEHLSATIGLAATAEFRNIPLPPSKKTHTFLLCGWARFRSPAFTPFFCTISNALTRDGLQLPVAEDSFQARVIPLANNPFLITSVGQPVPRTINVRLTRTVRSYVTRERGPALYIQLLATAIRETAGPNHRLVGRNLMAISLPKTALPRSTAMFTPLAWPIQFEDIVALYLPDSTNSPVRYAPNYTCNGLSMSGISFRPGGE